MAHSELLRQYMTPLLRGRRKDCRDLVTQALESGTEPRKLYRELIWPALEEVDKL